MIGSFIAGALIGGAIAIFSFAMGIAAGGKHDDRN